MSTLWPTVSSPAVHDSCSSSIRVRVVFPAPFLPTSATFSWRAMMKSKPSKTVKSSKHFLRVLASKMTLPERGAGGKRNRICMFSAASTSTRSSLSSFLIKLWAKAALFFLALNLLMSTSVSWMYFCWFLAACS